MLSSVAERVYWLGRYMERAENLARLIRAYSALLFDLPKGTDIGWDTLLDISGGNELFKQSYSQADERSIMKFLIMETDKDSSILYALKMLRENARTAREVIPSEVWEQINDLYYSVKDFGPVHISRIKRQVLLDTVIADVQLLNGMLSGCMSHNNAYGFIHIGRKLERADMSTRIVDVGSISFMPQLSTNVNSKDHIKPYENIIWMNVLRCLGGYQAYRQSVDNRVEGEEVVRFILQDSEFPRAMAFCLNELNNYVQRLPRHENVLRAVARVSRLCKEVDITALLRRGVLVHFIDELQISIADIHDEITATWFRPA